MLRKLGSPRRGNRFAASSTQAKDGHKESTDLQSAMTGGGSTPEMGIGGAAEAKSPPTSPTKKRLSLWNKKNPTTTTTQAVAEVPRLDLSSAGGETLLKETDAKAIGSIQKETKSGSPTGLSRPLVRTPRQRMIVDVAEAKPSSPTADTPEEKKKPVSKRDSLGLKSFMAKRDKATPREEKIEPTSASASPLIPQVDKATTREADRRSPTKKKSIDKAPDPVLSPIRRQPRVSSKALDTPTSTSTTATIREATALLSRKTLAHADSVPPMQQPEVHIIGDILGGDGFCPARDGYCCKWSVDYGNQWIHVAGDEVGQTQIDYADAVAPDEGAIVWAHPIDLHFATTALHGWPKLLLQVWRVDAHMKMNVVGYGFVHVPFAPGHHHLSVAMWRPMGTSKEELGAALLGNTPELLSDEVLFNTAWAERCRLKTIATGRVHVSLGIVLRNFDGANMDM